MKIKNKILSIALISTMMLVSHSISPVAGITQHLVNRSFETQGSGNGADAASWTEGTVGRHGGEVPYSGSWGMWLYDGNTAYQDGLWADSDDVNYFSVKYNSTSTVQIRVYYDVSTYSSNTCSATAGVWATCSISSFVGNDYIVKVELISNAEFTYFDLASLISGII